MTSSKNGAVPRHIAIIMDGNGRWAKRRLLPRLAGHKQGVESLRRCARACVEQGVQVLTVFAFSSENWNRPQEEVSGLMSLLATALAKEVKQLSADGVRLYFVGDRQGLSEKVRAGLAEAERITAHNTRLILNVCFNYGGRWDIAQAAQKVVEQGLELTPENLDKAMALAHVPDPDLMIRTGGETRISNFCSGKPLTRSCSSAIASGPTSTKQRWTKPSRCSVAGSVALARLRNKFNSRRMRL